MSIEEKIVQYIQSLPEHEKAEVLDFIDYLKTKGKKREMREWGEFSLSFALRGMENEEDLYSLDDLEEAFS